MFRLAVAISALALLSTAAAAMPGEGQFQMTAPEPTTNPATTADDAAADNDPTKIICRTVRPPTGTRLTSSRTRQRICLSKADWEQQERDAQEAARDAQNTGRCDPRADCSGG